ncbi:hypothetical protein MNEG_8192 [Monoraphidium neglectum]|uniref:Uncharacterized protein n=1 Tax=Monoraphidium neglectum TaxID=145388 RepID=A0A0D2JKJ2_9CHLO|nr:hypothetical protein MNEG_8192 [Monoraphidium neglectum]KIY99772.1 hypothetical protein MNEG_8192 [Monoraphidium neglectum]|eukprot:XP_013898792.1 hypothetical protein MNEG_8192 [Monoraphidium neglectum]
MAAEHVAGNMDKAVSSFIRSFEENYTKFEAAIRKRVDWSGRKKSEQPTLGRAKGGGGAVGAVGAAVEEWGGRQLGPRLGPALAASSDDDSEMSL